jgi:hypothetical protein
MKCKLCDKRQAPPGYDVCEICTVSDNEHSAEVQASNSTALLSAVADYLAVDGHFGIYDLILMREAQEKIINIIGVKAIKEAQSRIYGKGA